MGGCGLSQLCSTVDLLLEYEVFLAELLQLLLQSGALLAPLSEQRTQPLTLLHLFLHVKGSSMGAGHEAGVKVWSHLKRGFQLCNLHVRGSVLATPHRLTALTSLLHCGAQGELACLHLSVQPLLLCLQCTRLVYLKFCSQLSQLYSLSTV